MRAKIGVLSLAVLFLVLASRITCIPSTFIPPKYPGKNSSLNGIPSETEILFDTMESHISMLKMKQMPIFSLGFVSCTDRLFQMEMMRRVGTGTLADFLGPDLLECDKFF